MEDRGLNISKSAEMISHKEFQNTHPTKSRWITYRIPEIGYFKIRKPITYEAWEEWISELLGQSIKIRKENFINKFGWVPFCIYNEVLRWSGRGTIYRNWMNILDSLLENKFPAPFLLKNIVEKVKCIKIISLKNGIEFDGKIINLLYFWLLYFVFTNITVKRCKAEDCNRIFTLASRKDQAFCSNQCRMRIVMRRRKKQ